MRTNFSRFVSIFGVALFAISVVAHADTLFSNLNQPNNQTADGVFYTFQRLASDFITSNSASTITAVILNLDNKDDFSHTLTVSLFNDSGGVPGTLMGSFSTISLPADQPVYANQTATSSGFTLAPDATYWLVLSTNNESDLDFVYWSANDGQAVDAGSIFSTDAATQIKFSDTSGSTYVDERVGNPRFSLTGTVVPEPSSVTLIALACSDPAFRRRMVR